MTRVRSCLFATLALVATIAAPTGPAAAAPEGQMTYAVHVSLAPTWFDPAETSGIITPFMVLYALHDALVKPMPGKRGAEPGRVVDGGAGRAELRVRPAQGRAGFTTASR